MSRALKGGSINQNVSFENNNIDQANTLNPFTHIYMFDVGFPSDLHYRIAKQFNKSEYATYIVSYKAPKSIIDTFSFNVTFMKKINTTMHGKYSIILLFPRPHKIIIFSLHVILF
jgi:hypothetical protein